MKRGIRGWGYVPGLPLQADQDYSVDLHEVPEGNLERVKKAEAFAQKWLASAQAVDKRGEGSEKDAKVPKVSIPWEWQTAYDLRTWPDFPDRPARES